MIRSKNYKILIIYLLAFLTGVNFVIFPSLASVFTDSSLFDLSSSQFGNLFIPQTICIIISSLITPILVNKFGPKKVLSFGILMMLLTTAVLWTTHFYIQNTSLVFIVLMIIVSFLGFGFGITITTLNPIVANLFPKRQASAILIMQFLVVLGTSSLPFILSFLKNNNQWLWIPSIIFDIVLIGFIFLLFIKIEKDTFFELPKTFKIPKRLWIFIIAIIFYGLLEGTYGSFGSMLLKDKGFSASKASLGLSLFWAGMAISRLVFGLLSQKLNLSWYFIISPLIVGVLLFLLPNSNTIILSLSIMGFSGFFMGSIFPGSIGWGTIEFPNISVLVSGVLMASNQIGTGISTNILGSLTKIISLGEILKILSVITIFIFVFFIILKKNSKIDEAF